MWAEGANVIILMWVNSIDDIVGGVNDNDDQNRDMVDGGCWCYGENIYDVRE